MEKLTINTPTAFEKILIEENTMGSAVRQFLQNNGEKNYTDYFTKAIGYNSSKKQVFSYQYILTNAGVFNTGNTFVNIETKALKQKTPRKTIQLFLPTTEIRIEE